MDSQAHRAHLGRELAAYAELLGTVDNTDSWGAQVPSCPGWAIRDLTHHLVGLHYWVTDAINGGSGRESGTPMPADTEITGAFLMSAAMLQQALDHDSDMPSWTFTDDVASGAGTVGFWQRRQPHEHAIHRWDLERSLGLTPVLDPLLSGDGIDEVVTMFWPRQIALGRAQEPAEQLRLIAIDVDATWLLGSLGPTSPAATMTGSAADILLALWKRIPPDAPALSWSGDREIGAGVLALKLVP